MIERLARRFIKVGRVTVIEANGRSAEYGDGTGRPVTVRLKRGAAWRLARKPTLALYGSADEYSYGDVPACVAVLAAHVRRNVVCEVMDGADHGFSGRERELGDRIATFLTAR